MLKSLLMALILSGLTTANARPLTEELYWMKIQSSDKVSRTKLANTGVSIEHVGDDYITAVGTSVELKAVKATGLLETSFSLTQEMMDFPIKDEKFHNYSELYVELQKLAQGNPDIVVLDSLGTAHNPNHNILHLRISTQLDQSFQKPGIVFMGGHHAREHVSVEMPLMLTQYLVNQYRAGNPDIVALLQSREIHIIPMVNPDGAEYDISTGNYKMWRKNLRDHGNGTYGVDLNRNYGYQWGTGGSSNRKNSDVYMGTHPFSEPETQAIKNFIELQTNISILVSFHTFSELILYPWGHTFESISDHRSLAVHQVMANTMAQWNGYTPQQSSELYIASGDTTDWSFGQHNIISFTFELDPKSMWSGGFYPGQSIIDTVFRKNINPSLYLINYADNPYRVLEPSYQKYGLNSPLVQ